MTSTTAAALKPPATPKAPEAPKSPAAAHPRIALLRILGPAGRGPLTAITGLALVKSLLPAATALIMAALVERAESHAPATVFAAELVPLLLFGLVLLAGHVIDAATGPLTYLARARIDGAHRARLARLAATTPTIEALERPDVQALIRLSRAEPENWTERTPADGALGQLRLLLGLTGLIGSCAVLAGYALWPIPLLLGPAAANQYLRNRQAHQFTRVWRASNPEWLHADVWKQAVLTPGTAVEQRVFGAEDWMLGRMMHHALIMFEPIWAMSVRLLRNEWTQFLLVATPLLILFGEVADRAAHGRSSVALETAVFAAGWSVFQTLGYSEDVRSVRAAADSLVAYDELCAALGPSATAASAEVPAPAPAPDDASDAAGLVRFEDVSFRYPGTERLVLDGLDLEIRQGELLALVGLNGAGKSTLIKLLSGLYLPTGGRITAGGRELGPAGIDAWREQISVVFQDFAKYHLPVRDNVALGRGRIPVDEDALAAAARDAGLDQLLTRLPDGWDTPLSRAVAGGVDLSGGQWQQVVLARALYAVHTGARLLVLDEPTAHLDVRTEFDVFHRLAAHKHDAGVVLISHRLSTVRQADRIVLLEDGRITETGDHDELLALGGRYAELFAIQAERFTRGYDDRVDPDQEETAPWAA
ncbi:ATP-binding cassette domain-containing protein [Actinospica durhamensis]|uniref:ATP-binding cassette domain-containing protein n=1 Tax=Actinospica durhamensis TaxID=1508375 RepID=A0A941ES76_9ACTN|nr:ATP-binding cassette domain-containing protein [Actinospica durhamensis]MBR7835533.1 ATP-binding cassette domain-containing protein [Actinospica durhamensis]